jgi:Tfp pilus assembly protein PilO
MIRTFVSIVCLVAAGGIFFMYTQPAYDTVQGQNVNIAQYDGALQKATELQQIKQTLLAKYNSFDPNNIDRLQKMLPDHVDNVRLILDMDNLAQMHGMALQNVSVSAAPTVSGQTAVGTINAAKQKYDSLTIKFTTVGSYDTFRQFLSDLQSSLRIVDLVALDLTPVSVTGAGQYSYDITLRTYWLK